MRKPMKNSAISPKADIFYSGKTSMVISFLKKIKFGHMVHF